jgi:hypothetical protein
VKKEWMCPIHGRISALELSEEEKCDKCDSDVYWRKGSLMDLLKELSERERDIRRINIELERERGLR